MRKTETEVLLCSLKQKKYQETDGYERASKLI